MFLCYVVAQNVSENSNFLHDRNFSSKSREKLLFWQRGLKGYIDNDIRKSQAFTSLFF